MSHGARAVIPDLLCLVEAHSTLSAVVRMPLVADLVSYVAVIEQAYQVWVLTS